MARVASTFVAPGPDTIKLRVGDRLPSLVMQLVDDGGDPVDLTTGRVYLTTRRRGGVPLAPWLSDWTTAKECLVIDAAQGVVYYDVQPQDTITNPGIFDLACLVRLDDGTELTIPTEPTASIELSDAATTIGDSPVDDRLLG